MKNDKRSNRLDAFFSIDKILQIHFQILLTYRVMHLHKFHKLEFCKREKPSRFQRQRGENYGIFP